MPLRSLSYAAFEILPAFVLTNKGPVLSPPGKLPLVSHDAATKSSLTKLCFLSKSVQWHTGQHSSTVSQTTSYPLILGENLKMDQPSGLNQNTASLRRGLQASGMWHTNSGRQNCGLRCLVVFNATATAKNVCSWQACKRWHEDLHQQVLVSLLTCKLTQCSSSAHIAIIIHVSQHICQYAILQSAVLGVNKIVKHFKITATIYHTLL